MRKLLYCALMITLLSGCSSSGQGNKAESLALDIRTEYLAITSFSANAALTADYGHRVYQYELDVTAQNDTTTLTLTAPETIAGITAQINNTNDNATLVYEDLSLETGPLNQNELTPMSAIPAMLEAVCSGYLTACTFEENGLLRMDCGEPDVPVGTGTELSLWFEPETHLPVQGEIRVNGFRHISCTFSNVTKE